MAEKKSKKKSEFKSGFSAPTIGRVLPEGTTFRRGKDGRLEIVPPKKKK